MTEEYFSYIRKLAKGPGWKAGQCHCALCMAARRGGLFRGVSRLHKAYIIWYPKGTARTEVLIDGEWEIAGSLFLDTLTKAWEIEPRHVLPEERTEIYIKLLESQ